MNAVSLNRFQRLEEAVLSMPPADVKTTHLFAPNQYARTIHVPAGTVITGAKHKVEHITIVSKGLIRIYNDLGEEVKQLRSGDVFVTPAGSQRAGLVIEDTVWTDVFSTPETNVEQLEATLVENYHGQLKNGVTQCLS